MGQLPRRAGRSRRRGRVLPAPHGRLDGSAPLRAPQHPAVTARRRAAPPTPSPPPLNFWASFAAAPGRSAKPGPAGGGRGAVRCAFSHETPRVAGCPRPLRHAAGRCGAFAPFLMPSGVDRGEMLARSPSLPPPRSPFSAPLLRLSPLSLALRPPATALSYRGLSPPKFSGR